MPNNIVSDELYILIVLRDNFNKERKHADLITNFVKENRPALLKGLWDLIQNLCNRGLIKPNALNEYQITAEGEAYIDMAVKETEQEEREIENNKTSIRSLDINEKQFQLSKTSFIVMIIGIVLSFIMSALALFFSIYEHYNKHD